MEFRDGLCGICPAGCWVRIGLKEGRIESVEPLEDHPLGMVCRIGKRSAEIVYDPDRLKRPMRRSGPKGTGKFEPVDWDTAFEFLVDRLQEIKRHHGPEAVAIYTGRGSFDMALCDIFQPAEAAVSSASSVLFPFGSPNTLGVGALCYVSFAMIAPHVTMGEMLITMDVDLDAADLVVIWGANPATDSPPLLHRQILEARQRGAEIIAIDPRRAETARQTEAEWVAIRPGTDGALALAMIQVLIEEELYDESFVEEWTVGFEELEGMTQHYRPEIVEAITGVPAETIRSLARRIASARGAVPVTYTGLEYSDSGVQAIRAVLILWALAGQLDVPGGLVFRMKENIFPQNRTRLIGNPDVRKALGREKFPIYSHYRAESHAIALPDAVLKGEPYAVRALIVVGGSLITSWPNPDLWRRTLNALDLLVTIDRYPTADSQVADLILPATTQYETTSYMRYGPLFKIREKIIEPIGEARNDFLILAELARRLGYGDLYPQSEEELLALALEPVGLTVEEVRARGGSIHLPARMMQYKKWEKGLLRPDGKPGFATPTGKLEIASTVLAEHGYDPLPVYTEPQEGPLSRPDLSKRYPLVFNSGARTPYDFRSQHHGVPGLSKSQPEPTVTMHREDAAARSIQDGQAVWVETLRGRIRYRARVTEEIVRGAIDANMGGGGPLGPKAWQECNVNELTDPDRHDPISGFPIYKTLLCEVRPADGSESDVVRSTGQTHPQAALSMQPSGEPQIDRRVYLDHNATTPVDPGVLEEMSTVLGHEWGNPSSIHSLGDRSRRCVEAARRRVARSLNCTARRIIFTGGGSEANNLAIQGLLGSSAKSHPHIVTSPIEHPAVLATCRAMERRGARLTYLPVDRHGRVDLDALADAMEDDTVLVTVMMANNETGTIQPISEICAIAHARGVPVHTDAVQAFGKIPVDVEQLGVDLLTISAHKIYGPKGIGALYHRRGITLEPLIYGGGQEREMRAGTENVAGIVGFGKACEIAERRMHDGEEDRMAALRNRLEKGLSELIPDAWRNGPEGARLPNTLCMTLPEIRGESLVLHLDRKGICFSSGSACKSGDPNPSHVLLAIGLTQEQAHCTVRFSLGASNDEEAVDWTLAALEEVLRETRNAVRFVPCR